MPEGTSYESVRAASPSRFNIVSDPPRVLDTILAREQVDALDQLPRPTVVTCRGAPFICARLPLRRPQSPGKRRGRARRAELDNAPFAASDELRAWVTKGLAELC